MQIVYKDLLNQINYSKLHWYRESRLKSLQNVKHFEKQVGNPIDCAEKFISFLSFEYFENLDGYLEDIVEDVMESLEFSSNEKDRLEKIDQKIQKLDKSYKQNNFTGILSPHNFIQDLNSSKFPYNTYLVIFEKLKTEILQRPDLDDQSLELIFTNLTEDFFNLTYVIMELKLLQSEYSEITAKNDSDAAETNFNPDFNYNKYPKVFKSPYAHELFKYLVSIDDEKITPAWAQKYFDLFKDEKLIKVTSKKVSFIRFLKKEYQISFSEMDIRASYNEEANFLKDIEKDFTKKYNVTR